MNYTLPKTFSCGGADYAIRWDYRAALDLCAALSDPALSDTERALAALIIFYPDFSAMPETVYGEALKYCMWFLNCGEPESPSARAKPRLMSWEQDFPLIAAPVSRVLGFDIRDAERGAALHWWTFIAAYMEIGECTFAQVVSIRSKRAKGKKLEKAEREWLRENRELVEMRTVYTEEEKALLASMSGKMPAAVQKDLPCERGLI